MSKLSASYSSKAGKVAELLLYRSVVLNQQRGKDCLRWRILKTEGLWCKMKIIGDNIISGPRRDHLTIPDKTKSVIVADVYSSYNSLCRSGNMCEVKWSWTLHIFIGEIVHAFQRETSYFIVLFQLILWLGTWVCTSAHRAKERWSNWPNNLYFKIVELVVLNSLWDYGYLAFNLTIASESGESSDGLGGLKG